MHKVSLRSVDVIHVFSSLCNKSEIFYNMCHVDVLVLFFNSQHKVMSVYARLLMAL